MKNRILSAALCLLLLLSCGPLAFADVIYPAPGDVEAGSPLMRLREVVYDQKGRPLHNSLQLIRGDRFVFRI